MESRSIRQSGADKVFTIVNYIVLTIVLIVVLFPLIYIVSASFSSPYAVMSGKVWLWPVGFSLAGYKAVFKHSLIISGYTNSLFYAFFGTLVNIFMTVAAAYPLSRKDFYGRNLIMFVFMFTMYFSGGLIPWYLVVRSLGLYNNRLAMIIPGAMSVWNVIITRTYFQTNIPVELLEASQLDGCSDFKFVRSIVIPLSGPILAVNAVFYAVGHWNAYFNAMILLSNKKLWPLQLILREILVMNEIGYEMILDPVMQKAMTEIRELLKYSLIIVASLPVLIIYPFAQKYFVKGVMIGAIKG